ncbi:hypothetical protein NQ314_013697 [Rhamnusium bicolor]|uniref:Ubiquitin-like domain-containing protein n=1 Tax=Rhamnusium bicolor TaxID=1586634 RepID=A0AAV8X4P2_9CUCU|nr:hypothetical protein NQ314_013697 [Rhamnusium bicolor]
MAVSPDVSVLDFSNINKSPQEEKQPPSQIIVKFYTADAKVFTQTHPSNCTISNLKEQFEDLFGIPYDNIFCALQRRCFTRQKKAGKTQSRRVWHTRVKNSE